MKIIRIKSKRAPFYHYQKRYGSFEIIEQYPLSGIPRIEQLYTSIGKRLGVVIMNPKVRNIDADILFLNDDVFPEQVGYIRKHNPKLPIVVRYSNPVRNALFKPEQYLPYHVVLSSFQKSDCQQYNMKYAPAYFDGVSIDSVDRDIKYDAVYFGRDKGRVDLVKAIETALTESGYHPYIHISADSNRLLDRKGYRKAIPYEEVCKYYIQSKAIIDIQQKFQDGLDIRAIASIMYNKKLIINNPDVVNMKFYTPSNMFIVGKDDLTQIGAFMEKEFVPYSAELQQKYSEARFRQLLAEWTGTITS